MDYSKLMWQELEEEMLSQNPIFSLYKTKRRNPRGDIADFYHLQSPDWVTVLAALTQEGEESLLAVVQHRHGSKNVSLEFPAGIIEHGESVEEAAGRELMEECSYKASKLTCIGSSYSNPAILNNRMHIVLAEGLQAIEEQEGDPGEFLLRTSIKLDDLREGRFPEHFTHALMFTALTFYWVWERKNRSPKAL